VGDIFVAALAFLLARALEKNLKAAGVRMSSAQALEALRTVSLTSELVQKSDAASPTRREERVPEMNL